MKSERLLRIDAEGNVAVFNWCLVRDSFKDIEIMLEKQFDNHSINSNQHEQAYMMAYMYFYGFPKE